MAPHKAGFLVKELRQQGGKVCMGGSGLLLEEVLASPPLPSRWWWLWWWWQTVAVMVGSGGVDRQCWWAASFDIVFTSFQLLVCVVCLFLLRGGDGEGRGGEARTSSSNKPLPPMHTLPPCALIPSPANWFCVVPVVVVVPPRPSDQARVVSLSTIRSAKSAQFLVMRQAVQ